MTPYEAWSWECSTVFRFKIIYLFLFLSLLHLRRHFFFTRNHFFLLIFLSQSNTLPLSFFIFLNFSPIIHLLSFFFLFPFYYATFLFHFSFIILHKFSLFPFPSLVCLLEISPHFSLYFAHSIFLSFFSPFIFFSFFFFVWFSYLSRFPSFSFIRPLIPFLNFYFNSIGLSTFRSLTKFLPNRQCFPLVLITTVNWW